MKLKNIDKLKYEKIKKSGASVDVKPAYDVLLPG